MRKLTNLDAARPVVVSQKCVLMPYDQYVALRKARTRAASRLKELKEVDADQAKLGHTSREREAFMRALRFVLGEEI